MNDLNLDQTPKDINEEEFQLERVRLQAFIAAIDPGCTPIDADLREQILKLAHTNQKVISKKMLREGAFHLIIVSYPRQDKISKGNGCAVQHDFMLLTVRTKNLTSKASQSPKKDLENTKTMLNSSLKSIENLRANIKEEAIGLAKKWGIIPEFEKKRQKSRERDDLTSRQDSGTGPIGPQGLQHPWMPEAEVDVPLRRFRRQYEQLSQFERGRIIGLMEAGWSARRVARELGRSVCVVRRYWDQWIREMSFTRRSGSGQPRQTSRREDRHIVRNAREQPTASLAAIQTQVEPSLGAPVSSRTIRRRLA
ncbi:transposable element Tcb2 transposase [Trichonephila clavipes]|nr:transposable element Tcb2 transposase [Trichonephila clavipes]